MRHPDDPQTATEWIWYAAEMFICLCGALIVLAYVYDPACLAPIFGVIR